MRIVLVVLLLALAAPVFAQNTYELNNLKKNAQGLYIDKEKNLVTGFVKGYLVDHDMVQGVVIESRIYDYNGILLGRGVMKDGSFTGIGYNYRPNGSVRFEVEMLDSEVTKIYCVQGDKKTLLNASVAKGYEEPDCE